LMWPCPILVKSQAYTIPSPGAQRELCANRLNSQGLNLGPRQASPSRRWIFGCQTFASILGVARGGPPSNRLLMRGACATCRRYQQLTYQIYLHRPWQSSTGWIVCSPIVSRACSPGWGARGAGLLSSPTGWTPTVGQPAPTRRDHGPELAQCAGRFQGLWVFLYISGPVGPHGEERGGPSEGLAAGSAPRACVLLIVGDGPLRWVT